MVLIVAGFEMVTEVGAPLFANDAVSTGTVGEELQLVPVVHSVPGPVQVPSTACAASGISIVSAPMYTLPRSAARVDRVRAPGAAIRMAMSPVEMPNGGSGAECAVRERNRCEHIPDPCNDTAGKTRSCATLRAAPATDVRPNGKGGSAPDQFADEVPAEIVAVCGNQVTPAASAGWRARYQIVPGNRHPKSPWRVSS